MAAGAIPLTAFGNSKVLLATDVTDGVHTLAVTTDTPDSAVVFEFFQNTAYKFGTVEDAGVHTLCVTQDAADSAILFDDTLDGDTARIGTVLDGDVHTLAVTTNTPDSSVVVTGFNNTTYILPTVLSGGVHTLVVNDEADAAVAFDNWWGVTDGKNIMAAVTYDGVANTVAPVVSGTTEVGETLSCTSGTWTGAATITYAYQWRRDGVAIDGETAATYELAEGDLDAMISCLVTATNWIDSAQQVSNSVGPVTEPP